MHIKTSKYSNTILPGLPNGAVNYSKRPDQGALLFNEMSKQIGPIVNQLMH